MLGVYLGYYGGSLVRSFYYSEGELLNEAGKDCQDCREKLPELESLGTVNYSTVLHCIQTSLHF